MKFEHLQGSIVAMVTPFRQDGSVNFDMLTELLERQIAAGTDGILTLGTTGEYSTMSHEEDAAVVEHTIRVVDGRVPVMVGSGSNCTVTQIEKSRLYQSMGADALLLISPYYNKANAEGMYRHFAETADAVDIPCILYNVPGRTGCSIPVSVVERLARHPNIAGIKEASGDMSYAMKIARCVGPDFALYSGNDDITVPILSIGGSGIISGNFTLESANDLALLLRSGALPAPLEVLEERTVGAGLGSDSIREGITASIIGLIAVIVFMVLAYGLFGIFTTVTVLMNLFLMLGALSFMGATLTLPGIAGIILTIGMAVDANVLIFERMREEVKNGRSTKDAAEAGFTEAWGTIVDSNLTTLVAAFVLFYFGTGPVRGFAVTLAIGIATSMFTSVTVTRLIIASWLNKYKPTKLPI